MQGGKRASRKLVHDVSKPPNSVPQESEYVSFLLYGVLLFLLLFFFLNFILIKIDIFSYVQML